MSNNNLGDNLKLLLLLMSTSIAVRMIKHLDQSVKETILP